MKYCSMWTYDNAEIEGVGLGELIRFLSALSLSALQHTSGQTARDTDAGIKLVSKDSISFELIYYETTAIETIVVFFGISSKFILHFKAICH